MPTSLLLPDEEENLQQRNNVVVLPGLTLPDDVPSSTLASVRSSLDSNPDKVAKAKRLSDASGLPQPLVERNPEDVGRSQRLRELQDLMSVSPVLARQMADPNFAKLAHDDAEKLSTTEQRVKALGKFLSVNLGATAAGATFDIGSALYGTLELGAKLLAPLGDPFAGTLLPVNPLRGLAQSFEGLRKRTEASSKYVSPEDPEAGLLQAGIQSGFRSFGQMGPGIAAAIATRNPMYAIGAGGLLQGVQSSSKALDKGKSPWAAAVYGAEDASAEMLTEMLPMGVLIRDLKAGSSFFKVLGHQIATEVPTELAATAWQNFNEWANLHPEKTLENYVAELGPAEAQTVIATITTSLLTAGFGKAAHGTLTKLAKDHGLASQAQADFAAFTNLINASTESKLRERDPSSFQQFVDSAAANGPVTDAWIDPNVFAATLSQAGIDESTLATIMPTAAAQLAEGLATGMDVRIPLGELASAVPGTGLEKTLIQHLRVSEHAPSAAEAQVFFQQQGEEFTKRAEDVLNASDFSMSLRQSAAAVEKELLTQLGTANRFTLDVNQQYAKLMSSFYTVQAARLGITPEEMYVKYPLQIRAESPIGAARTMGQNAPENASRAAMDKIMADPAFQKELQGNADLLDFAKGLHDKVQARVEYGALLARHHTWDYNVGDVFQSSKTGRTYKVVGRSFTMQGQKVSSGVHVPTYLMEESTEGVRNLFTEEGIRKAGTLVPLSGGRYAQGPDIGVDQLGQDYISPEPKTFGNRAVAKLTANLTLREKHQLTPRLATKVLDILKSLPAADEMAAVAYAGRIKRGWYAESANAISQVFGFDAPRFAMLLAALSPQVSVESNLTNALTTWKNWNDAGRPSDSNEIRTVLARSVQGKKGEDSVMEAWVSNVIRALGNEDVREIDLSGPKVNSFYANLVGDVNEVTNDTWMARYAMVEPLLMRGPSKGLTGGELKTFAVKSSNYLALSVRIREAAVRLTELTGEMWTPAEVQETVWTWTQAIYEMANSAGETRKPSDIVKEGGLAAALQRTTPNFGNLFYSDKYRDILIEAGYANELERLERDDRANQQEPGTDATEGQAEPFAEDTQRRFELRAARRLDTYWRDRNSAVYGQSGISREPGMAEAQAAADAAAGTAQKLIGLPDKPMMVAGEWYAPGPLSVAQDAAAAYMESTGLPFVPPRVFARVDVNRATRIAQAFEDMKHDPNNPDVKAAYQALADETLAQWQAIKATGLTVEFIKGGVDPYAESPRAAIIDVRDNNHLWVFPTEGGFGSDATDVSGNPLLAPTDEVINGRRLVVNDVFRIVHDYFGHIKDGNGFRADGEENAWRSHAAMYSPLARRAMTSETRGQNSWVNYGPYGTANRQASAADTHYAPQKTGLLPEWASEEGRIEYGQAPLPLPSYGTPTQGSISLVAVHFSPQPQTNLDSNRYGTGMKGAERERTLAAADTRLRSRTYFYVPEGNGVRAEEYVGLLAHGVRLNNLYDAEADPLRLFGKGDPLASEAAVIDAGYAGYYSRGGAGGRQGAAVLLGAHSVPVAALGFEHQANALLAGERPPEATYDAARTLADAILHNRALPGGRLTPIEWRLALEKTSPELVDQIPAATFQGAEPVYKDQLVRTFYQPAPNRGQVSFATDITASPSTITLLQNADLSTFLHEMGHFQLEVLAHMALQPNAPDTVTNDTRALLKWFGVSDLAAWNAMTVDEKRDKHEMFARGFESYLFEGRSPNTEMNGVFARLRSWMVEVYKQITALKVNLTDEVRGVMNRLIATDEQIATAEDAQKYTPYFKDKPEDMTDAGWLAYQRDTEDATRDAVEQLQSRSLRDMLQTTNARAKVLKQLQKDAATKRKAVHAEVAAEVNATPIYQAMRWLRYGEMVGADGEQIKADKGFKLDIDALAEMYPATMNGRPDVSKLGTGRYGLMGEQGLAPDLVAEMFGFTSGDELVHQLLEVEPARAVIEAKTDTVMLERYGDLSDQASMERAASEAVHNDARIRSVATEYRALAKAVSPIRAIIQGAKDAARKSIAQKKIRDIRPAQYTAAEARASVAAAKAAGDIVAAKTHKLNQLLNGALAREAQDAVAKVEKGVAYLKRVGNSKTIDVGYREQIETLLERYDLRAVSNKAAARRQTLLQWVEAQRALGFEPVIDETLLDEARRTPYRELSLEEFSGLVDAVRNIEHLGRLKDRLLNAKDKREFAAIVESAAKVIEDNAKRTLPVQLERNSWLSKMKSGTAEFFAMHRKFANMIREMDGYDDNGVLWGLFSRPMNEAAGRESVAREKATIKLTELMAPILKTGHLRRKMFIPEIGASLSREGRIMVALNTGNEGNLQRLMDGDHWTKVQVDAVVNTLTKDEMDFVQAVWDFVGSYRGGIGAQQKRLTGVEPEWVEPSIVHTRHGDYRGGYLPVKYDTTRSTRALSDEASSNVMDQWRAKRGAAKTRDSFTKARASAVVDRPMRKDFGVITQHLTEVTHRLAWQEYLIDAQRLLRASAIDNAVRDHYGPEVLLALRNTLEDVAAGEVPAQNSFEAGVNYLRTGATVAGLGWRVTTALLQPIGLTQSIVRIGVRHVGAGLAEWLGDAARMESTTERIFAKSDMMRLRAKTMQREISEIRNQVAGKSSAIEGSFFYMIQKMQMVADIPTWLGQYHKSIDAGADEGTAVAQADQSVLDAQGGGQIKDLSGIQRGGPLLKLFTNFYSFFNTTYNLTSEAVGRTDFKNPLQIGMLAVDMLLLYSVPAVLGTLMKAALHAGGGGDEEKKFIQQLIADQLTYLLGTVVGLRELAGGVQTAAGLPGDYQGPASMRLFAEVAKLTKQVGQGEVDQALLKALDSTAGILFHYPAGQINATVTGIAAMADGRVSNPGALLVGAPAH